MIRKRGDMTVIKKTKLMDKANSITKNINDFEKTNEETSNIENTKFNTHSPYINLMNEEIKNDDQKGKTKEDKALYDSILHKKRDLSNPKIPIFGTKINPHKRKHDNSCTIDNDCSIDK